MAMGDRVTAPGHVQLGELHVPGRGTPYRWRSLSGWEDLPALDSGSVNRADGHGAILGRLLAQARPSLTCDRTDVGAIRFLATLPL